MYDDIQKKRPISNPLNKVSTGADNDLCIPGGDKKKKKNHPLSIQAANSKSCSHEWHQPLLINVA